MTPEVSLLHLPMWPTEPARSVLSSREEYGGDHPLLSVSAQSGVRHRDVTEGRAASEDLSGYRVVRPGDLVINRLSARDGAYAVSALTGLVSPAYWVLRAAEHVDSRWVDYVLRSSLYRAEIARLSKFMPPAQFDLPWPLFRRIPIPVPPIQKQRAIADFLDRETAQIDAMVDAQERLVALLEGRKRSLILGAVTGSRGCSSASRRPSGLRWAGDIPSHWEVGNIRRFAQMKTGHTPSRQHPEYWEHCTIPWFTLADVWQLRADRTHVTETSEMISELGLANSAAELLPAGTVMLSRTASVGFSGIMSIPMATSQDYWNWVCGPRLVPEYLLYTFHAMFDELRSLTAGSTHKTIYEADAAALRIVVPPVNDQRGIVSYLEEQLERIGRLAARAQESIALMKERRSALISAAVTGRIDVRTGVEQAERDREEVGA